MSPTNDDRPFLPVRAALRALIGGVCARPRLVLAVCAALAVVSMAAAAMLLQYHTSRNDLISSQKDYQQRWRKYLAEFGEDDDIVVVARGTDRGKMRAALDAVAAEFEKAPDLFDRIFYKVDLRSLRGRALALAPTDKLRTIAGDYLADLGPLLDFAPLSWTALGLHGMIAEANGRLDARKPGEPFSAKDLRFLKQLAVVGRVAKDTVGDPGAYESPWDILGGEEAGADAMLAEPHYFFSGDGVLAFLLCRPVKEAGSFTAALKSVTAARSVLASLKDAHPDVEFGLTGLPVLETDEMVAAEADTRLASWLAIAGVGLLFLLVYRGIGYPVLTMLTLLVGTAWAFGFLTLTVGHLNILSTTFAVMLIGMGDYGVLWVMRYEEARKNGMAVRDALLHTADNVAIGNLTAAGTLALAFYAAIFADFKAVAELGWIAGSGVLLCAFACFTFLPACLMVFDRRTITPAWTMPMCVAPPTADDTWLPWLRERSGVVLALGLACAAVVGSCAARVSYDHNLLHLQAENLDSVKWEHTLLQHTTGASMHALSYTASREEALALAEKYRALPEVSQVVEVAALVPLGQEAKLPLIAAVRKRLSRLPVRDGRIPHIKGDPEALRKDVERLARKVAGLSEPAALTQDLYVGLWALEESLRKTSAETAADRVQRFDQRMSEDLAESLHRLRDMTVPEPIRVEDLPAAVRERYIGKSSTWLLRVFAKEDLWDYEPLERFTEAVRAVDPEATGKPFGTFEGLKAMKHGLIRAGIYAFAVIVLVLWLDFRGFRNTLLAVLPLLLGVVMSVGVLGLCGMPLNPANMIAFPLILGVGVDNGVHVLHDHLIRRREGRPGISRAIGRGVLVKALTTMMGFGALMVSTERGLVGLGFILTLGVGCSMLASLVLLPAALELLTRRTARPDVVAETEEMRRAA